MKRNFAYAALAVLFGSALSTAAIADAAGVGAGVTTGTYSATAASTGATLAPVGVSGQIGTFSQSSGTQSSASAGMAIGARGSDTLSVASDGVNNFSVSYDRSSAATVEGFGTASSVTSTSYAGDGIQAGSVGVAASAGSASAAGAFLGVGIIAAAQN